MKMLIIIIRVVVITVIIVPVFPLNIDLLIKACPLRRSNTPPEVYVPQYATGKAVP